MTRAHTTTSPLVLALAGMTGLLAHTPSTQAQAAWDLLTVSNTNTLMRVDLSSGPAFTATPIGVTQDASGGPVRRIRGLAYAGSTLYGMTREGDLVTVNPGTGQTSFKHSVATTGEQFWSDLAYDAAANALYTVNAFGDRALAKIDLGNMTHSIQGPTVWKGNGSAYQMLGVEFSGGTLLSANRSTNNIVDMDPTSGLFDFTFGSITCGVNNLQQIAVHPGTGALWGLHDGVLNSATLSTFDPTYQATKAGQLPFGILEQGPTPGTDTYGWGGMAFTPVPSPGSLGLLGLGGLIAARRRR
jgi:MYXO-CTERM domain-containing protein